MDLCVGKKTCEYMGLCVGVRTCMWVYGSVCWCQVRPGHLSARWKGPFLPGRTAGGNAAGQSRSKRHSTSAVTYQTRKHYLTAAFVFKEKHTRTTFLGWCPSIRKPSKRVSKCFSFMVLTNVISPDRSLKGRAGSADHHTTKNFEEHFKTQKNDHMRRNCL